MDCDLAHTVRKLYIKPPFHMPSWCPQEHLYRPNPVIGPPSGRRGSGLIPGQYIWDLCWTE